MPSISIFKILLIVGLVCFASTKRTCKPRTALTQLTTGASTGKATAPVTPATPSMNIVTGPIIGKVNTTTARILIEFDTAAPITVILTDPTGNTFNSSKTTKKSIPVPFSFDGLQVNTKYTVTLNDSTIPMVESYFTTLSGQSGVLNFAVMSCNDQGVQASKTPEADLWADLLVRIQNNEVQYLLQTGDQVYMDDPFGKGNSSKPYQACMQIINSTAEAQWGTKKDQLLEILRNEYRQTWGGITSTKEVLAKIPSLTIIDDHEVEDDWGYLKNDYTPNSPDQFYGTMARQVYYEYERQLREDVDFDNIADIHQDYYYEILNDIGFFFIEYRGIRSWNRNYSQMGNTQLGLNQTQLLESVLDPANGAFANLSNSFLVSPLTVVFLVEALVKIGYYSNNDAEESWSYKYSDQQIQLLDTLRAWKTAQAGRELTILDGDIHMAGYTNIYYGSDDSNDIAFTQFTASSMASSAPSDIEFDAFELLQDIHYLQGPWGYKHHDWTNKFNYGIVLSRFNNNQSTNDCYLVKANDHDSPKMINSNGSDISDDEWTQILQG